MSDYIVNAEIHLSLSDDYEQECRQEGVGTQDILRELLQEKFETTSAQLAFDPVVMRLANWSIRPQDLLDNKGA